MKKFITTPIYYASGDPHLGHAYSTVVADTLKRFYKLFGNDSSLITGTDENGQKIEQAANAADIGPKSFVDQKSDAFHRLWRDLSIDVDVFVRTTSQKHKDLVARIWQQLVSQGDIYLGRYEGRYCIDCEQFYSDWQLDNNYCPIHKKPVGLVSEPSYLFRLSHYRERLLEFYKKRPDFIEPAPFKDELVRYLKQPKIDDLSISRLNVSWGISVPGDQKHTVYVWLDALFSYLTAITSLGGESKDLRNTVHVIGKDILLFHGVFWPAFLLSIDAPLPQKIVTHGWWTVNGDKISKSDQKTKVDPVDIINVTTIDGLRYGLIRQKALHKDGNICLPDLIELLNSDLANNLGNLVKRHATLVNKYFNGKIQWIIDTPLSKDSKELVEFIDSGIENVTQYFNRSHLQAACVLINEIISKTNGYIHLREPWNLKKSKSEKGVIETLCVINAVLNVVSLLYAPIIPEICKRIREQIGVDKEPLKWPDFCNLSSISVKKPIIIFNRINSI